MFYECGWVQKDGHIRSLKSVAGALEKAEIMRDHVNGRTPYHYEPPKDLTEAFQEMHHEETENAAHRSVSGPHIRRDR